MSEQATLLVARLHGFLVRESAQTLAEYGLILTVVGVGVVVPFLIIFRTELADAFTAGTRCLDGSCP